MHSVELQAEQMCYAEEYIFALYFFLPVQKTFYSSVQFSVIISSLAMLPVMLVSVFYSLLRDLIISVTKDLFFCHYFFKHCHVT